MSDLVQRLRETNNNPNYAQIALRHLAQEAADEIEHQAKEIAQMKADWKAISDASEAMPECPSCASKDDEIAQLRAEKKDFIRANAELATLITKQDDDAERFRFIESNLVQGHSPHMDSTFLWSMRLQARGQTFADAIDAQRAGEEG